MTAPYIEEFTECRKCGEQHRVDEYRGVKHYVCPEVNRVMLLVNKDENTQEQRTEQR